MNKFKDLLKYIVPTVIGIVFASYAWIRLSANDALLYAAQEHSIWLSDSQFFNDMIQRPGGIFSWVGRYLTQYFYYPSLGISILVGFWLLIYSLIVWGSKMRWWLTPVVLLPLLMLLWAETSPTYFLYQNKVPDLWFTPTLIAFSFSFLLAATRWLSTNIRVAVHVVIVLAAFGAEWHWIDAAGVPAQLFTATKPASSDENFLSELRIERSAIAGDWKGVLSEMKSNKGLPTRQMLIYQYLALYNTDRLISEWGHHTRLTQLPKFEGFNATLPMTEIGGARIYLYHGCIQFAHRWAMEEMVEYSPSVGNLRLMSECALMGGEYDVVRKYTGILKKSTFHRQEAEALEQLAAHPENIVNDPRYKKALVLVKQQKDMLDSDNNKCENYLWTHYSTLVNGDVHELNDLCIHYAMQTQDIERFWNQFFAFAHLLKEDKMPRILQEAAYLYGTLEPQRVNISQMPFDQEVKQGYDHFMKSVQAHLSMGKKEAAVGAATQREFGHTFYWFYYFCRNLETY